MEDEAREAQEQLAELVRSATEYSNIIKKKEVEIARLTADLDELSSDHDASLKAISQLEADIASASAQLDAQKRENQRSSDAQAKVQKELDELRHLLEAKTSEETRRREVERSKDQELIELRNQVSRLLEEASETRRSAIEGNNRLKAELETIHREHSTLQDSYQDLVESEKVNQAKRREVELSLSEVSKIKRQVESELLSVKTRLNDSEGQHAETSRAKEVYHFVVSSANELTNHCNVDTGTPTHECPYQSR